MSWTISRWTFALVCCCVQQSVANDIALVRDGQPLAEIVIDRTPTRSVRLAAHEFQTYVQKISGARLPIVVEAHPKVALPVFIGRSAGTEARKLSTAGLSAGAFRIARGENWLALLGNDRDFTPIEPWARSNTDIVSGKLQREWDAITGALWGVPHPTLYKNRLRLPGMWGLPEGATVPANTSLDIWTFDERGSYNAVCAVLNHLGVRWYLPGELGEVLPHRPTITLADLIPPAVPAGNTDPSKPATNSTAADRTGAPLFPIISDQVVRPDIAMRRVNIRLGVHGLETALWFLRLGMRDPYEIQVAHGLDDMTHRPEILERHPEWFALYGGKRQTQPGQRLNQLCYSNPELFEETVRYVRQQFDHYQIQMVSVMPPDGYTAICQCPLCAGKDSPHRDQRGYLSDYVWDFVNRVAREVRKTHPDRQIMNCAYGVYTLPPEKIEKLEPNVVVSIVGGRRPTSNRPDEQAQLAALRAEWAAKTAHPLIIFENYPFTDRGWYLPAFVPHTLGSSINAVKGQVQGEDIWLTVRQDFDKVAIGFNHILVYFTARMYWGGAEQDVDAMFREYCRLFYGPAEREMWEFFTFCEGNWQAMERDAAIADRALQLFAVAQQRVANLPAAEGQPSVYAQRIALIDDFLKGLRHKRQQLAQKRGPVPVLRLVGEPRDPIVIDGKLDDAAWEACPTASTGRLRELETGVTPIYGTSVKSVWRGKNLYFAIRCDERPGEPLNVTATRREDQAIWYGDVVELLIQSEAHAYYQLAISPAGALVDLDRGAPRQAWFSWDSQAEVATHIADDHWTVEIRVPVTEDDNDPLHQIIGHKPTPSLPWYVNVCRQRVRSDGQELSALSPTAASHFHEPLKFAHYFAGNSHQFEVDETVQDFLTEYRRLTRLNRQRDAGAEKSAWLELAAKQVTPRQKSTALEQAALLAGSLQQWDEAEQILGRIPVDAVRHTATMELQLARGQAEDVVEKFGKAPLEEWPFWQRGAAYFARGRAFKGSQQGTEAESDFQQALLLTPEFRQQQRIQLEVAQNALQNLQDSDKALAAYRAIVAPLERIGGADEFTALIGSSRILADRQKYDEALATLERGRANQLKGAWRGSLKLATAEVLARSGRITEARAVYQALAGDDAVEPRHRQAATAALEK